MELELFSQALHIESPYYIKEVAFNLEEKRLNIHIDFEKGSKFHYCQDSYDEEAKVHDTQEKEWRHLNFFEHECYLQARVPRVKLSDGKVRLIKMPWAGENTGFTLLFEALVLQLAKCMPIKNVADLIHENDDKLWRILDKYVEKARDLVDFSSVKSVGIDETSKKKGHAYITLFVDMERKKTIFITEGKSSETVVDFVADLENHAGNVANIKDVSCDMSPAFIKGVKENLPNAEITFDKFHILKIINKAVDEVRKEKAKSHDLLKNTKYFFLKNHRNLSNSQSKKLSELSMPQLNLKAISALHIRENFQEIYNAETQEDFENLLKKWYFWATHSRLEPIKQAAYTIKRHWDGVLKWYESKINNGVLEGLNSVIQAAKAKARGFKTTKNLKIIAYLLTANLSFESFNPHTK